MTLFRPSAGAEAGRGDPGSPGTEAGRGDPGFAAAEATAAGSPHFSLEEGLGFRLGRTHRALRAAWETRIVDLGLSGPQASVLRAVAEQPGVGLRELARVLGTDPMNAKRLVDGLEQEGMLTSAVDPTDRRLRALGLTDAGLAVSLTVARRAMDWRRDLQAMLGRDDAARLWLILERIEDGIAALSRPTIDSAGEAPLG